MKARHAPGPWKFGHMMDGERWWVGQEYDRLPVAFVDRHDWPEAVVDANLRLIAAAPDLLASLRNLVGLAKMRGGNLHEYGAAIKDAEAALSKAEGK